ncbi:unnamed protein product [Amoebophrya sp. A120]|nr:unnamed protein product [Amoebophrya sp. A120]|eukprot:GSA120T00024028001.1
MYKRTGVFFCFPRGRVLLRSAVVLLHFFQFHPNFAAAGSPASHEVEQPSVTSTEQQLQRCLRRKNSDIIIRGRHHRSSSRSGLQNPRAAGLNCDSLPGSSGQQADPAVTIVRRSRSTGKIGSLSHLSKTPTTRGGAATPFSGSSSATPFGSSTATPKQPYFFAANFGPGVQPYFVQRTESLPEAATGSEEVENEENPVLQKSASSGSLQMRDRSKDSSCAVGPGPASSLMKAAVRAASDRAESSESACLKDVGGGEGRHSAEDTGTDAIKQKAPTGGVAAPSVHAGTSPVPTDVPASSPANSTGSSSTAPPREDPVSRVSSAGRGSSSSDMQQSKRAEPQVREVYDPNDNNENAMIRNCIVKTASRGIQDLLAARRAESPLPSLPGASSPGSSSAIPEQHEDIEGRAEAEQPGAEGETRVTKKLLPSATAVATPPFSPVKPTKPFQGKSASTAFLNGLTPAPTPSTVCPTPEILEHRDPTSLASITLAAVFAQKCRVSDSNKNGAESSAPRSRPSSPHAKHHKRRGSKQRLEEESASSSAPLQDQAHLPPPDGGHRRDGTIAASATTSSQAAAPSKASGIFVSELQSSKLRTPPGAAILTSGASSLPSFVHNGTASRAAGSRPATPTKAAGKSKPEQELAAPPAVPPLDLSSASRAQPAPVVPPLDLTSRRPLMSKGLTVETNEDAASSPEIEDEQEMKRWTTMASTPSVVFGRQLSDCTTATACGTPLESPGDGALSAFTPPMRVAKHHQSRATRIGQLLNSPQVQQQPKLRPRIVKLHVHVNGRLRFSYEEHDALSDAEIIARAEERLLASWGWQEVNREQYKDYVRLVRASTTPSGEQEQLEGPPASSSSSAGTNKKVFVDYADNTVTLLERDSAKKMRVSTPASESPPVSRRHSEREQQLLRIDENASSTAIDRQSWVLDLEYHGPVPVRVAKAFSSRVPRGNRRLIELGLQMAGNERLWDAGLPAPKGAPSFLEGEGTAFGWRMSRIYGWGLINTREDGDPSVARKIHDFFLRRRRDWLSQSALTEATLKDRSLHPSVRIWESSTVLALPSSRPHSREQDVAASHDKLVPAPNTTADEEHEHLSELPAIPKRKSRRSATESTCASSLDGAQQEAASTAPGQVATPKMAVGRAGSSTDLTAVPAQHSFGENHSADGALPKAVLDAIAELRLLRLESLHSALGSLNDLQIARGNDPVILESVVYWAELGDAERLNDQLSKKEKSMWRGLKWNGLRYFDKAAEFPIAPTSLRQRILQFLEQAADCVDDSPNSRQLSPNTARRALRKLVGSSAALIEGADEARRAA